MAQGKKVRIPFCTPEQSYFVSKMGIKIYPVGTSTGKTVIAVEGDGEYKTFPKELIQADINDALEKTTKYYYDKLKNKPNE